MPLRDDILNPIPGDNPSGDNLRYAPVYDKIKEARRQDDDAPQGDWKTARKVADYKTVIKLAGEAIATKSKDLQLAAWLTEALLHTERIAGLNSGLTLIRGLIENFWDTLYPELEDGEAEYRAAPLDWVGGSYLTLAVKQVPLTKAGHNLLNYQEAKIIGREEEAAQDYNKQAEFQAAIAEGKLSMDEWDKAFAATSKAFYVQFVQDVQTVLQTIEDLQPVCEEKFGEFSPSFNQLRVAIEEVQRLGNQLLDKKKETEPDPEDVQPVEESVEEAAEEAPALSVGGGAAVQPKRVSRTVTSLEPADKEDAVARVAAVAAFWRKDDPGSPAPYLLLRGLRWGELRASSSLDPSIFEAPATAIRTNLKRMLTEGSYAEVIELAENAMAMPCGRAWLDLQRYVVAALDYQGYSAISEAIKSELKALIRDYPDLPDATLLDDTPTANRETQEWLKEFAEDRFLTVAAPVPVFSDPSDAGDTDAEAPPDTFALAMQAASSGRSQEALELLASEIGRQNSGRGRFQRKLQLAQVCLTIGQEPIAHSILEELAATIDKHDLEHWEAPDVVAHALALLWGCINRNGADADAEMKQKLYSRICRLDPVQALGAGR